MPSTRHLFFVDGFYGERTGCWKKEIKRCESSMYNDMEGLENLSARSSKNSKFKNEPQLLYRTRRNKTKKSGQQTRTRNQQRKSDLSLQTRVCKHHQLPFCYPYFAPKNLSSFPIKITHVFVRGRTGCLWEGRKKVSWDST